MLAVGHKIYFDALPEHEIFLAQIYQKPLILYRRWEAIILELFQQQDLHPHIFCKNDDARTTAYWADAGLGIGIIPASALKMFRIQIQSAKKSVMSSFILKSLLFIIKMGISPRL